MKLDQAIIRETLQILAKLEQQEPSVFADLVLLSRSEHMPIISVHSLSRLHKQGFVKEYNFEEGSVILNNQRIAVLRRELNESKKEIRSWLTRIAEDYPDALLDLHRAISTQCSVNDKYVFTLAVYHLIYKENGVYYPMSLACELVTEIEALVKTIQQLSDTKSE